MLNAVCCSVGHNHFSQEMYRSGVIKSECVYPFMPTHAAWRDEVCLTHDG